MPLTIAGQHLDVSECARWLVDEYNAMTVEYYDLGGSSPRDSVTVTDIGRMTVFAARLNYKQADGFLKRGLDAPWPTEDLELRLDAHPDMENRSFARTPEFAAAAKLFDHLRGTGWPRAQTSKLLHMKWPAFFPVVDRECRNVYWQSAAALHEDLFSPIDRRSPEGYWVAIRADLLANRDELDLLRRAVREVETGEAGHVGNLTKLEALRLLDMIIWGLGRGNLPVGS